MARRSLLAAVKPSDREIQALARRETDPARYAEFQPIERGPVFALVAIVLFVLAALPSCAVRLCRGLLRPPNGDPE